MKTTFYTITGVLLLFTLLFVLVGCFKSPIYINKSQELENVEIQPEQAIKLAEPYIDEHATYSYREDKELKIHIVKLRKWYYIRQTNYPAKTTRYYMNDAIKVNSKTGEIVLPDKK